MLSLRPSVLIAMFVVQSVLTLKQPELEINLQDRQYLFYQATLAETAERYDDMAESMKKVTELKIELSVEERNSLALAYNHEIGLRQASLRKLKSMDNEADKNDTRKVEIFMNYIERIEGEVKEICETVLDILNKNVIPMSTTWNSTVFFYTMKGDYYRFFAEVEESEGRKIAEREAFDAYKNASDTSVLELAPTNPIRLKLALNFSNFYYEVLKSREQACRSAKTAYGDAFAEQQDMLSEEIDTDSTLIMQLLQDKMALWLCAVCLLE